MRYLAARRWVRVWFAGPGAFLAALVIMTGMATWVPKGAGGVDNIILPLFFLPLIWSALFFHACLDRRLRRVAIIAVGLGVVNGGMVARVFLDPPHAARAARP